MLSDLSVQLLNSSPHNLWTNSIFFDEFSKLIFDPIFNLLHFRVQDNINLLFDIIDVGLIKALMLI